MNDYDKDQNEESIKLTPAQIDSLMELGNIGSGHAITALSQLMDKRIEVSLTSVDIVPFWKLPERFGGEENEVFGILSSVKGEQNLSILQLFPKESTINMINSLSEGKNIESSEVKILSDLDDSSLSTITEVGNILSGHYANALADLMEIKLVPDVPDVAFDVLRAIMNGVIAKTSETLDLTIIINTKLEIEDLNLEAIFCFLPAVDTLNKLFKAINLEGNY
jgi:chemotaxis protein CheC